MDSEHVESRWAVALEGASLGKVPPGVRVATGHEEEVMLLVLRVGDAKASAEALMGVITLAEAEEILQVFQATGGLIRKRFAIEEAYRLKEELEAAGTAVEFVRPDEGEEGGG